MAIKDLIGKVGRTIAYHPALTDLVGSVEANILLTQLHFWHDKIADADGWIYKSQEEIAQETGMSINAQRTARKLLKERGLIEEQTTYRGVNFRVNIPGLIELWGNRENILPFKDKRQHNRPSLKCLEARRNGIEKINPTELKKSIPLEGSGIEKINPTELKKSIPLAESDRKNQSVPIYREIRDQYLEGEQEGEKIQNPNFSQPLDPSLPEQQPESSATDQFVPSCWSNFPVAANFDFLELSNIKTNAERDRYWWQNFDKLDDYLEACMARPAYELGSKFISVPSDPWMSHRNVRSEIVGWYLEYRKRSKSKNSGDLILNRANCAAEFRNNYQRAKDLYWEFLNETVRPEIEAAIAQQKEKELEQRVPDFRNPVEFGVLEHDYLISDMLKVGVSQFLAERKWHRDWLDFAMNRYPKLFSQLAIEQVEKVIGKAQGVAA